MILFEFLCSAVILLFKALKQLWEWFLVVLDWSGNGILFVVCWSGMLIFLLPFPNQDVSQVLTQSNVLFEQILTTKFRREETAANLSRSYGFLDFDIARGRPMRYSRRFWNPLGWRVRLCSNIACLQLHRYGDIGLDVLEILDRLAVLNPAEKGLRCFWLQPWYGPCWVIILLSILADGMFCHCPNQKASGFLAHLIVLLNQMLTHFLGMGVLTGHNQLVPGLASFFVNLFASMYLRLGQMETLVRERDEALAKEREERREEE